MNAFVESIYKSAETEMARGKILSSLTIAQAILESGWGSSGLSLHANNIFGIKADNFYQGDYITMATREEVGGKSITINAKFRRYKSLGDSLYDHTNFLLVNHRYKNLLDEYDYKKCCQNIQLDGYATDSSYAKKLINIIENYNLYRYDMQVETLGNLKLYSKGTRVKVLQSLLCKRGFKCSIDGVYGQETFRMVKAFQLANHTKGDGICGLITVSKF